MPDCIEAFEPGFPEGQENRVSALREMLLKEYFLCKGQVGRYEILFDAHAIEAVPSPGSRRQGCFETDEDFLVWYEEIKGSTMAGYKPVPEIPLDQECANLFGSLLYLMVAYSVGLQTYMPYSAAAFAMANKAAVDRETAGKIYGCIKDDGNPVWHELYIYTKKLCVS
ncbi:MAG: hypothetical protein LIO80_05325 [Lachnospiraceae bacterium]|nr:hypothetical protein [Lachnospiraceae bacterium]